VCVCVCVFLKLEKCILSVVGRLGHHTIPEEVDDVCKWLNTKLGLDGK
jgi:hypothetical protein